MQTEEKTELIEIPENGSSWLFDASINTEEFLIRTLGEESPIVDLEIMDLEWDHDESILGYLPPGMEFLARDNTYNSENDFENDFQFSIIGAPGGDWCWQDGIYVAIVKHEGGDPRGNYGRYRLYGPIDSIADSYFLDFSLGWYVEEMPTASPLVDFHTITEGILDPDSFEWEQSEEMTERASIGYSSSPISELCRMISAEDSGGNHGEDGEWVNGHFYFEPREDGSGPLFRACPGHYAE